ncbi:uncharacterized protein LOC144142368 [Haemaphysalis longicornis]
MSALGRPVPHVGSQAEKHHLEVADSPACWPWRVARFNNREASCWPHGGIFGCWTSCYCCRVVPGSGTESTKALGSPGRLRSHPHASPPSPVIWNNIEELRASCWHGATRLEARSKDTQLHGNKPDC